MSEFNATVGKSLDKLYDQSCKFNVSIDLIQKLASHLKIDTFIDKDATHSGAKLKGNNARFERLSVAGSRMLIDIDYTNDTSVTKLSLSVMNHISTAESAPEEPSSGEIDSYFSQKGASPKVVMLNFRKDNVFSFVRTDFAKDGADRLLFNNLTSNNKLNAFPVNLKLLNDLDKLSTPLLDLFHYSNNLALFFLVVHRIEQQLNGDWHVSEGFSNSVGKPTINNTKTNELGIFLHFWHDYRYINRELSQKSDHVSDAIENDHVSAKLGDHVSAKLGDHVSAAKMGNGNVSAAKLGDHVSKIGNEYVFKVYVAESPRTSVDYLTLAKASTWPLKGPSGEYLDYKFALEEGHHATSDTNEEDSTKNGSSAKNWSLFMDLNHPVVISAQTIELLGIFNYKSEPILDDDLHRILQHDETVFSHNLDEQVFPLTVKQQVPSTRLIALSSFELNSLHDIPKVLSVLRSQILLNNLLKSVINHTSLNSPTHDAASNQARELTTEAKDKLKESLKLPDDVTEEELLSLSAVSDNAAAYSNTKLINTNEVDLDRYMDEDDESDEDAEVTTEQQTQKPDSVQLTWSVDFENYDVKLKLQVHLNGHRQNKWLKITNGVIQADDSGDVEMDGSNEKLQKFIKCLNLSEDVVQSIQLTFS